VLEALSKHCTARSGLHPGGGNRVGGGPVERDRGVHGRLDLGRSRLRGLQVYRPQGTTEPDPPGPSAPGTPAPGRPLNATRSRASGWRAPTGRGVIAAFSAFELPTPFDAFLLKSEHHFMQAEVALENAGAHVRLHLLYTVSRGRVFAGRADCVGRGEPSQGPLRSNEEAQAPFVVERTQNKLSLVSTKELHLKSGKSPGRKTGPRWRLRAEREESEQRLALPPITLRRLRDGLWENWAGTLFTPRLSEELTNARHRPAAGSA